ncbi:unnamed protein product [Lepidochelys kempii]
MQSQSQFAFTFNRLDSGYDLLVEKSPGRGESSAGTELVSWLLRHGVARGSGSALYQDSDKRAYVLGSLLTTVGTRSKKSHSHIQLTKCTEKNNSAHLKEPVHWFVQRILYFIA